MRMLKTNHGTVSVRPTSRELSRLMCEIAHNFKLEVEELMAPGSHEVVDVKLRGH
jgi:hypothetical protein